LIINDLGFKMEKLQHPVTTNPNLPASVQVGSSQLS
jgi:hypothetical protein